MTFFWGGGSGGGATCCKRNDDLENPTSPLKGKKKGGEVTVNSKFLQDFIPQFGLQVHFQTLEPFTSLLHHESGSELSYLKLCKIKHHLLETQP